MLATDEKTVQEPPKAGALTAAGCGAVTGFGDQISSITALKSVASGLRGGHGTEHALNQSVDPR